MTVRYALQEDNISTPGFQQTMLQPNLRGCPLHRLVTGWAPATTPLARSLSSISKGLDRELKSRRIPLFFDYLTPQPSHLLDLTLNESLSKAGCAVHGRYSTTALLPSIHQPPRMKVGYHLAYFPPQVPLSQLLSDGTDTLHSPGNPFDRRLWAGGRVRFPVHGGPLLSGNRAVCLESIRDITVKGPFQGKEMIFVRVERRIGLVDEFEEEREIRSRIWRENEEQFGDSCIIESRSLAFMREKTKEQLFLDQQLFGDESRIVQPPSDSHFRYKITPTKAMLFRFSALTFNAHLIHLDPAYVQQVEGYRNLLVHGPLSLVLLLSVVRDFLSKLGLEISETSYRNLDPLYVDRELTICGKPKSPQQDGSWEVWIENDNGGLAVRGIIHTLRRVE